jgi:gliding motility-associated-like protein
MMKKNILLIFTLAMAMQQAGAQLVSPDIASVSYNQTDQKYYISWVDKNTTITPDTFKIYVFSGYTGSGQPVYDPFESVNGLQITAAIDPQFTIGLKTYDLFNNVYSFAVEAFRTGKTPSTNNISRRPYLNAPNNILLNLKQKDFDTCNYTLTLTWNKYYGWNNSDGQKYEVLYGTAIGSLTNWNFNGTIYTPDTSVVLPVNIANSKGQKLLFNTNYFFKIVVDNALANGLPDSSNIGSVNTNISAKPAFINADGTIIQNDNQHIQLSFTKDINSPMHKYNILRSENYGGPYIKIDSIDDARNTIIYIDAIDALSKQYFYKLEVLNNCGLKVGESNIESSILLKGQQRGIVNNLNWNAYQKYAGNLDSYVVFRSMQLGPFVSLTSTTDTIASDRLDTMAEKGILEIRYYIIANEVNNPQGITGLSWSNTITITPNLPMPDFFTPKGLNPYLKPPGAFNAKEIKFIVYDRWGTKVFETSDSSTPGWDGKVNGGYAPQGAYIFYLKVTGSDNKIIEQRGSFLLLLPK